MLVQHAWLHIDGERCRFLVWVVMPNHAQRADRDAAGLSAVRPGAILEGLRGPGEECTARA
ncbi:MAG TPA: hypothetical protein DIW77_00260 [Chromatiaceae bacterium]|nr:MAG: hypothetical protein N838_17800 [Thiohalocapsa sp. PB-PSB1]HCS88519.1 hypothetical protein [Chromatiaceae bacterium]